MSALRPIKPLNFPDLEPGAITSKVPRYLVVPPTSLLVDERYQRNLSEQSRKLIRKIVAGWDWAAFKPPVVVETEEGLHVIDGQHTAIAAAIHPGIAEIPAQLVQAEDVAQRAGAFVKHNRDRLAVSQSQLHFALAAAGDEEALTINQVCARAGARVLKFLPANGIFAVGDIVGVATLRALVRKRYARGARLVLEVCVQAKLAPIPASIIKAVEVLLYDGRYAELIAAEDLVTTIRELGTDDLERRAKRRAADSGDRLWRALAEVLFARTPKKGASDGSAAAA